ncbi:MAG: TatD family hydrolase, partial [Patescibacteria group bacterium]
MSQYDADRTEVINKATDAGIGMICVGTDLETSKGAIELAQKYEGIWATVGLHPNDNLNEDFNEKVYEELLNQDKVVAMGEIGLDYYRTEKPEDQKRQKDRFIQQLELAKKIGKPLILHCRDSKAGRFDKLTAGSTGSVYLQMVDILKSGYAELGGVVHSYTGNLEEAKQFLDLGFCLGFNGIITFARQYDDIVKHAPLDRILLETDAPYLTPEPHRGTRNEPAYVIEVAKKIADEEIDKKTFTITEKSLHDYLGPYKFTSYLAEKENEIGMTTGMAWTEAG